jgi:hypothetical protein
MAAPDPDIQTFIKRLTLGTRQGKVSWRADNDQWFELDTGSGTAIVRSDNEAGDAHPYAFFLRNKEGQMLARAETLEGDYYTDWEKDIENLFKAARNQALGVDRTIQGVANELDLPELPPPDDAIPF